jgi:rRNA maturation endonuclease Nob1
MTKSREKCQILSGFVKFGGPGHTPRRSGRVEMLAVVPTSHASTVAYWIIVATGIALSSVAVVWTVRVVHIVRRDRRRFREGRCMRCGYDVRFCSDKCPECGEPIRRGK